MNARISVVLFAVVAAAGLAQAGCGVDNCSDVTAPDYQSGSFLERDTDEVVVIQFAGADDSFTITHPDGTVEVFTRTGEIRRSTDR